MSLVGRKVGNYVLEAEAGEGAMGQVYLARHPMIGKEVAVKVLRDELSGEGEMVGRFFQEARAVNDIHHPNIVDIIDYGFVDGLFYFTMERLEGETLASRLSRRGLTLDESRHVLAQCASALAACHERGIIHRDLKPENIFLTRQGSETLFVKLLDFGAAKLTRPGARVVCTSTGATFGTPFYMSPEQASGASRIDGRADLYSLGVIMFELFTGVLPFDEPTAMETLVAQVQKPPPRPCTINPRLPLQLEAICLRALEKEPARRFASAKDLEHALDDPDHYLSESSGEVRPIAAPYRRRSTTLVVQRTMDGPSVTVQRLPRRRLRRVALGAILAATVAGMAWSASWRRLSSEPIVTRGVESPLAFAPPSPAAPVITPPAADVVLRNRSSHRRTAKPQPAIIATPASAVAAAPASDPDTRLVEPEWATTHKE